MKAVCVLFAFCLSSVFSAPPEFEKKDINKHVPAACFDEKGHVITTGPECKKRFLFVKKLATWIEAHNNCVQEGKQLVSIRNRYEQNALEEAMVEADMGKLHMWMGATDQRQEGEFRWIGNDQAKMTYTNFEVGEPNNLSGNEHCLEMKTRFQWNDYDCNARKAYICEYYGQPEDD